MTLERAVEILNERNHRMLDDWRAEGKYVYGDDGGQEITAFEAIAIAEKYEREPDHAR